MARWDGHVKKTCSVDGCDRPARARGWCGTHYSRWRQHGDPGVVLSKPAIVSPGERYGRLTVLAMLERRANSKRIYLCRCDCGQEVEVASTQLGGGHTRSCGCLRQDAGRKSGSLTKHGHAGATHKQRSATYSSWMSMLARCSYPNSINWKDYGSRGITVCDRWRLFKNFLADMGERPDGTTLDRIDPDGNYEPSNCRWATPLEQRHNRRRRAS